MLQVTASRYQLRYGRGRVRARRHPTEANMGNYLKDNDDLRFYVEHGIDWAPLVEEIEQGYRSAADGDGHANLTEALVFYREMLETVGAFAADELAPQAARIDREGVRFENGEVKFPPTLEKTFRALSRLELHGMSLPRELGGLNCPMLLYFLNSELLARADVSVMSHHGFHGGIAMALLFFSLTEGSTRVDVKTRRIVSTRWAAEIAEIAAGKAWGCMDITEPDAGSDMAALRTRGELGADGIWRVTGEKIFITSGHGKYHFVIARTEAPAAGARADDPMAGLKGLSMFLVPMWEDTPSGRKRLAFVDRVEEKLGHHGSATCSLRFEETPAQLVGQRGEGFQQMLLLMNNARIGVAFEALGLCEAAWRLARDYAAGRRSMGKTIDRHEMIADALDEMETDIAGIRALAVTGGYWEELGQRLRTTLLFGEGVLDAEEKAAYERRLATARRKARRLTPLAKYLASEKAVSIARTALQIHGGVGYTTEYGAEKLLRDALVMPIYEGTSQIQCLMAMKDTLTGTLKNPGRFVRRMARANWLAVSSRDPLEKRVARLSALSLSAQQFLLTRTAADKLKHLPVTEWPGAFKSDWDPKRDFALAMLHAERLTKLLCDEAIAEILLDQAHAHPGRAAVLERHLERAEPRARWLHEEITSSGERLLSTLAGRE
jgi:alkylation response protein AidB-like acyl-CoA dehydrogenase